LNKNLDTESTDNAFLQRQIQEYEEKFSGVFDREKTIGKLNSEISTKSNEVESLIESYKHKKAIYDRLIAEAAIYDETIEFADLGFYKPSFSFDHSEQYKKAIIGVKGKQKKMVADKTAITCSADWTVEGSKVKGRTMTNRNIRMTARAFNNECDAAISKVKWIMLNVWSSGLTKHLKPSIS
jgi:hypothetical protein